MTKKEQDTDVKFVEALAKLLQENDLTELQVKREYGEDKTLNVRVTRQTAVAAAPVVATVAPAPAPMAAAPAAAPAAAASPSAEISDDPAQHPGAVTSPMVGTAYMQAEPGSAPFVTVGAKVKEGDTVLIIEAMKTMNQIPSPKSGTVTRILVEDSSPIEFGAPLMIIE